MSQTQVISCQPATGEELWRAPVDEDTALFLGYARVLRGEAAAVVLGAADHDERPVGSRRPGPAPPLALRRSALVVSDTGRLDADVASARATPEQVRLVVEVAGAGTLDAVAPLGSRVAPGDRVRLSVDVTRVAVLPITPGLDRSLH